ncbi:hypothetical protein NCS56_00196600 [Fusarium sp. Ph1]|nr:hypothetical protein NCS56_00196600 [Fusarium sp. Ph1]
MDYLLFPIHVSPDPEVYTTRGAEMVQLSEVFDINGQTKARPVIITTASLGYVQGIIFPASTLLQKPGSRNFQTLFCIESAFPMPKGTSGSAVFDSQTGLLAGYLVLGCPGKHTCYMVPVLAELNMLASGIVRCQVQLNVSAIAKVDPEKSAMTRFSFHAGGLNRSVPLSSMTPQEEVIRRNNRPVLPLLRQVLSIFSKTTDRVEENLKAEKSPRNPHKVRTLRGLPTPQRVYGRVLGCIELYEVLQKKRFRDDAYADTVGHCRRIYIDKPNGASVMAMIKATPASQVEGFRDHFAGYITPTPEPKFILRESDWWEGCFIISFNLPFFGIGTQDQANIRTLGHNNKRLRVCHSLSFLNLNSQRSKHSRNEVSNLLHPPFLLEAVSSFMVTGKSDHYWTAVFLDDDSFSKEPRLLPEEDSIPFIEEELDPIILKAETKGSGTTTSPRAYALATLAVSLHRIVKHQKNIKDWFKASLSLLTADIPTAADLWTWSAPLIVMTPIVMTLTIMMGAYLWHRR